MNEPINANGPANNQPTPESVNGPTGEATEELADLSNEAQQAEYRRAYLEQLGRMSCPGCGEDPTLPF